MYWTDWGTHPHIACAGMDGSHQRVIVDSGSLQWPNGLTIDYAMNKLYWIDAKMNSITYSDLDGSNPVVILQSLNALKHPFAISLFEASSACVYLRYFVLTRKHLFNTVTYLRL